MKKPTPEQQATVSALDEIIREGDRQAGAMAMPKKKWVTKVYETDKSGYDGSEELLQGQAEEMLNALCIEFRRVPDRIWLWLKQHAPVWIVNALVERWRGKPDLLMLFPVSDKYSLACEIELKSKKGTWEPRQLEYRERMPVQESRSPDRTISIVDRAQADAAIVRGLFEAQAGNEKNKNKFDIKQ